MAESCLPLQAYPSPSISWERGTSAFGTSNSLFYAALRHIRLPEEHHQAWTCHFKSRRGFPVKSRNRSGLGYPRVE